MNDTPTMISPNRIRLYVDVPLSDGGALEPSPPQAHYLLTVLRLRQGDRVDMFNGIDGEWEGVVQTLERRRCRIEVEGKLRPQQAEPGPTLLFAPLKRVRMELLLEKATELGVARLEPILARRSVVDRVNRGRAASIVIEAAEQCGRMTVPAIDLPLPLEERLATRTGDRVLYLGEPGGAGEPLIDAFDERGPGDLLIGPEGGFDEEELAFLRARDDVVPVSLGPLTLRAETAALAMLACWQALFSGEDEPVDETGDEPADEAGDA